MRRANCDMLDGFRIEGYENTIVQKRMLASEIEQHWHRDRATGKIYYNRSVSRPEASEHPPANPTRMELPEHTQAAAPEHDQWFSDAMMQLRDPTLSVKHRQTIQIQTSKHDSRTTEVPRPPDSRKRKMRLPGRAIENSTLADLSPEHRQIALYASALKHLECTQEYKSKRLKMTHGEHGYQQGYGRDNGGHMEDRLVKPMAQRRFLQMTGGDPQHMMPQQQMHMPRHESMYGHPRPAMDDRCRWVNQNGSQGFQQNQRVCWPQSAAQWPGKSQQACPNNEAARLSENFHFSVGVQGAHFSQGQSYQAYSHAAMPTWNPKSSWARQLAGPVDRVRLQMYPGSQMGSRIPSQQQQQQQQQQHQQRQQRQQDWIQNAMHAANTSLTTSFNQQH
eukprot:TRINITY_DN212_c0_g3_i1.p1 TRINITY_DN212_c0_g3~~TRINITY_DN212_c0_g3_i1.p1  ORF type:complete len:391 (+),score=37.22 TRINITY_DN212_c0_g3_i1:559-1731(+)